MKQIISFFILIFASCSSNKYEVTAYCSGQNDDTYTLTEQFFTFNSPLTFDVNIIHLANGNKSLSVREAEKNIKSINKLFKGSGANISFVLDSIIQINDTPENDSLSLKAIEAVETFNGPRLDLRKYYHIYHFHFWVEVLSKNLPKDRFNIYIFDQIDDGWAGVAEKIGTREVAVRKHFWKSDLVTATHEIGHALGLYHTHQHDNTNGLNNKTGDKVCDTPLTPDDIYKFLNNNCEYIGSGIEMSEECFSKAMINIMSYSINHCRYEFTPVQVERMYKSIEGNQDLRNCIQELRIKKVAAIPRLYPVSEDVKQ